MIHLYKSSMIFLFSTIIYMASFSNVLSEEYNTVKELEHSVRMLCNDDLSFTQTIAIEGNAEIGGKLRILGVGVNGSISAHELNNLHNLFNETRYDPIKCRREMFNSIEKILFPSKGLYTSNSYEGGASGNSSGYYGSFSTQAGPHGATGISSTKDGTTSCASSIYDPKPCVARY